VTNVAEAKTACGLSMRSSSAVLPVIRYTRWTRRSRRLAASVWSSDPPRARDVAARIDAGTVYINAHADTAPYVP
jgi:acyl-CoA reductase-like NAD-dependent aldehyde dehydrogenase